VRVHIWVQPGAKSSGPAGMHGGDPKLRVAAAPREGAANEEVVRYLTATLSAPRGSVSILAGHSSRRKLVEFPDSSAERFRQLFGGG
jgi:uncharacterized protein YggU (UPF0235/DUF167 family)